MVPNRDSNRLPTLLTRREAAAVLGVKPQTLSVWATTHRYGLPYVKVGRKAMYKLSDLEAFIERRLVAQPEI